MLLLRFVPDATYLTWLSALGMALPAERLPATLPQFRLYATILAGVLCGLWFIQHKWLGCFLPHFNSASKWTRRLLQLHFALFIPTIAFWVFYGVYWISATEAQWQEEIKLVPWHHDLMPQLQQLRQQIPEDASVLLILEQPGTISYAAFFNSYLYPRKVYMHRRELEQARITRDDVNTDEARRYGISWILTYSGPRAFDARQLKLEQLSK
ncbi:MAG: hypothetical protein RMM98_08805 [Acidobacteriota bacterium]|nr:hypothetical protein [Blastocatellia bacterium]MDW8239703.1 hypothetical protein [Acidobacteriota bacterium]